jgi:hypothetical protein
MTWLHVYTESGETVASNNRRVSDAHGYDSAIDCYGFDVNLWLPIALSIALSAILVVKGYGIATFAKWQIDLMALVIVASILLPLWPCYLGKGYIGLGWYLGAICAILTVTEYITKFRTSQLN